VIFASPVRHATRTHACNKLLNRRERVKVLRPTQHKTGNFWDACATHTYSSQSDHVMAKASHKHLTNYSTYWAWFHPSSSTHSNCCSHMCHCHQAVNLVPVKRLWCPVAGKLNLTLVAHWQCIKDFSGSFTSTGSWTKGDEHPAYTPHWAWLGLWIFRGHRRILKIHEFDLPLQIRVLPRNDANLATFIHYSMNCNQLLICLNVPLNSVTARAIVQLIFWHPMRRLSQQ